MLDRIEEVVLQCVKSVEVEHFQRLEAKLEEYKAQLRHVSDKGPSHNISQKSHPNSTYGGFGRGPETAEYHHTFSADNIHNQINTADSDKLIRSLQAENSRLKDLLSDSPGTSRLLNDKIVQLESRLDVSRKNADKLTESLEQARLDVEKLCADKQTLEKQLKKLSFDQQEKNEAHERQVQKLHDEINCFKGTLNRNEGSISPRASESILRDSIQTLESKLKDAKDKLAAKTKLSEEQDFEVQQLKNSVLSLKSELQALGETNISERRERHKFEMQLIDAKNRHSELIITLKQTEDKVSHLTSENEYLKSEVLRIETAFKNEKRKACALERDLEQGSYIHQQKDKEQLETHTALQRQVQMLRGENDSLINRMEKTVQESQIRAGRDQREIAGLIQNLRCAETRETDLKLTIEDLEKKLEFYKGKMNSNGGEKVEEIKEKLVKLLKIVGELKGKAEDEILGVKVEMGTFKGTIIRALESVLQQGKRKSVQKGFSEKNFQSPNSLSPDRLNMASKLFLSTGNKSSTDLNPKDRLNNSTKFSLTPQFPESHQFTLSKDPVDRVPFREVSQNSNFSINAKNITFRDTRKQEWDSVDIDKLEKETEDLARRLEGLKYKHAQRQGSD